jgi:hypothetical protein
MTMVRDMPPLPPPPPEQAGSDNFIIDQQHQLQPNNYNGPTSAASAVHSVATLSSPWEYDDLQPYCSNCRESFNPINRRHHCRLCGKIFCNNCSNQRSLIPPSSIVLVPDHGKKAKPPNYRGPNDPGAPGAASLSFSPDPDPDRMLTYMDENQQVLYGKGLEERFKLAREPLRVCRPCQTQLEPVQEELRNANSNAMRFNHIDPTDARRLFNSPLAFTLGHEIRKAAYTLNNLLPLPKRMGNIIDVNTFVDSSPNEYQQCKDECASLSPTLGNLDGVKIPARLLQQAKGVAVMTVAKGGFGIAGVEFGTGLVVARLGDHWSAPCAIGVGGLSWGGAC